MTKTKTNTVQIQHCISTSKYQYKSVVFSESLLVTFIVDVYFLWFYTSPHLNASCIRAMVTYKRREDIMAISVNCLYILFILFFNHIHSIKNGNTSIYNFTNTASSEQLLNRKRWRNHNHHRIVYSLLPHFPCWDDAKRFTGRQDPTTNCSCAHFHCQYKQKPLMSCFLSLTDSP